MKDDKPLTELISQVIRGDNKALEQFAETYGPFLKRVLSSIIRDREELASCYDDLILQLPEKLCSYNASTGNLKSWLYVVSINFARRRVRGKTVFCDINGMENFLSDWTAADHDLFLELFRLSIRDVVKACNYGKDVVAFVLRHYEGYEYDEIANKLKLSGADSARNLVSRGKRRFRKHSRSFLFFKR